MPRQELSTHRLLATDYWLLRPEGLMATVQAVAETFDLRAARRAIWRKRMWFAIVLAAMFLYPLLDTALGIGRIGSLEAMFVFVILAMGLNIVVGYAGLLDLGYAAFFAIGA